MKKVLAAIRNCFRARWTPPPAPGPELTPHAEVVSIEEARARKQETFRRAPEVAALTAKVRQEGQRNHFGEAIDSAMSRRYRQGGHA